MAQFKKAVKQVLKHEGVLSNYDYDPGGLTKYGISKRAYPTLDIENLSKQDAIAIYKRDYWDKMNLDNFPQKLSNELLDFGVNAGTTKASTCFQRVLNTALEIETKGAERIKVDGIIGPITIATYWELHMRGWGKAILTLYKCEEVSYYKRLPNSKLKYNCFKGWINRV